MTTFKVDDVKMADNPLPVAKDTLELVKLKIKDKMESCCKFPENLNPVNCWPTQNSFVEAVHTAYQSHYPLTLSPDIIWKCVAQGFAIHVNKNAEKLRHMFVAHEGKKKLEIQMDHFTKGSPDNDLEQAFGTFSDKIRENVGDEIHGLLTPDFSTTGPVEKAASQIVLMNTFKEYFEYEIATSCGIPSITLEGTVEDWEKLREKTFSLSHFEFQWWTDAVTPILDEFVNASSGVVNKRFWKSLYKYDSMSGGSYISGWIVALFPYLYKDESQSYFPGSIVAAFPDLGRRPESMQPNVYFLSWENESRDASTGCLALLFPHLGRRQERMQKCDPGRVTTSSFPTGTVCTPFTWHHLDNEFEMCFYAGFLGVGQDKKTLALKPVIGWAVAEDIRATWEKMFSKYRKNDD